MHRLSRRLGDRCQGALFHLRGVLEEKLHSFTSINLKGLTEVEKVANAMTIPTTRRLIVSCVLVAIEKATSVWTMCGKLYCTKMQYAK